MRGLSNPLLWCVIKDEVRKILIEIHEGDYGDHTEGRLGEDSLLWILLANNKP